jgi:hypothetical protein
VLVVVLIDDAVLVLIDDAVLVEVPLLEPVVVNIAVLDEPPTSLLNPPAPPLLSPLPPQAATIAEESAADMKRKLVRLMRTRLSDRGSEQQCRIRETQNFSKAEATRAVRPLTR